MVLAAGTLSQQPSCEVPVDSACRDFLFVGGVAASLSRRIQAHRPFQPAFLTSLTSFSQFHKDAAVFKQIFTRDTRQTGRAPGALDQC
jgi:hypothetical protein